MSYQPKPIETGNIALPSELLTLTERLAQTRGDTVMAAQFCEWDKPDHRNAPRVVRSIAFELATRLPDYRKLLLALPEIAELDRKDAAELFDYVLLAGFGTAKFPFRHAGSVKNLF